MPDARRDSHERLHALVLTPGEARGLRTVACYEATKGVLAVSAATLLAVVSRGSPLVAAQRLVAGLHLDPTRHYPRALLARAALLSNNELRAAIALALAYAAMRFVEAFGLWRGRVWAEWFGILSGAVYVPFELAEVAHRPTPVSVLVLCANVAIVAYLAAVRVRQARRVLAAR